MADLNTPPASAEEALARTYPPAVKDPCKECPWRREAAPGWLGPLTAEEWCKTAHAENAIACHKTIPKGGGWGPQTRQCRGAAIFRANVFKHPHNATIEVGPRDEELVFSWDDEFIDHHTRGGGST